MIFYCGKDITQYFNHSRQTTDYSVQSLRQLLFDACHQGEVDDDLNALRLIKNKLMLELFIASLEQDLTQEEIEQSLTHLAEAVLWCAIQILTDQNMPDEPDLAVLGMGRMAGNEMNFGSDLDLIFLYSEASQDKSAIMSKQMQKLLRHIASISPHQQAIYMKLICG